MTDKQRLQIYDELRKAHCRVKNAIKLAAKFEPDADEENAIDAVHSVLYLAEGVFARQEP